MGDRQGSGSGGDQASPNGAVVSGDAANNPTNANGGIPPVGTNAGDNSSGSIDATALARDLADIRKELADTRKEAAKYRTRLKALAGDDDKPDGTGGGNAPDPAITAQLAQLREGRIKDQLTSAAILAGAHYPQDVYRFVNMTDVAGNDGTVNRPEKVMEDLRKSYPNLFKPPVDGGADGAAGSNASGNPGDMNAMLRQGFRSLRGSSAR